MGRTPHRLALALALVTVLLGGTACKAGGGATQAPTGSPSPTSVIVPPSALATTAPPASSTPPSASPSAAFDLTGDWSGSWANQTPDNAVGTFTISWTQEGNGALSGTIVISGTPCLSGGKITGRLHGNQVSFGVVEGQAKVHYAGTVTLDGKKMGGSYATPCGKAEGTWKATHS